MASRQSLPLETASSELGTKSITGGITSMAAEAISFVLSLASTIVLARLLVPEDFGVVSMVTALMAFVEGFKHLGLSSATIQRKEISYQQISNLFWINLLGGVLILALFAAASPMISSFYRDPRLIWITIALSTGFLFGSVIVQHQAILRRQLRFGDLAKVQVAANLGSVALGIGMALKGFGYWSIVGKEIGRSVILAGGTWMTCRWIPTFPRRDSDLGSFLRFGRDISLFDMVTFFALNFGQVLIGRIWGAAALGLYSRAYQIMTLPTRQLQQPIQYVAEPVLSSLQNDPLKYERYFRNIISAFAFLYMPMMMYISIYSETVTILLLGKKWIEVAPILEMHTLAAFIAPVASICGLVMVTRGKTRKYFYGGIINAVCLIGAASIGVQWGPWGVAAAYAGYTYAVLIPTLVFTFQGTPFSMLSVFKAVYMPAVASLIMGGLLIGLNSSIESLEEYLKIGISVLAGAGVYGLVWTVVPGGRRN